MLCTINPWEKEMDFKKIMLVVVGCWSFAQGTQYNQHATLATLESYKSQASQAIKAGVTAFDPATIKVCWLASACWCISRVFSNCWGQKKEGAIYWIGIGNGFRGLCKDNPVTHLAVATFVICPILLIKNAYGK